MRILFDQGTPVPLKQHVAEQFDAGSGNVFADPGYPDAKESTLMEFLTQLGKDVEIRIASRLARRPRSGARVLHVT